MGDFRWVLPLFLVLGGCAGSSFRGTTLERGPSAYNVIPSVPDKSVTADYRLGPLDKIDVVVYQEPDFSVRGVEISTAGKVAMPLIGDVVAVGRTGAELADHIAGLYSVKYLEHPQVSVTVVESVSQKMVIQGEVTEPGVYDIKGHATLLEAISMAKGETRVAATRQVAIFRTVNGQRMGALFDVAAIRRGEAADPELLGNDVVVVGTSSAKSAWRDLLATAPILAVFRPLGY